ncbi:MAG TPA: PhoX family phosphatase [Thermoanaerobaculia bacterium]|nr:PhoX family phosphatase [Thermoanaerobaculia bacterium]
MRDTPAASTSPSLNQLIEERLSRRGLLQGAVATAALGLLGDLGPRILFAATNPSTLTFEEIAHGLGPGHVVAPGYAADVLLRWGDKVLADAPAFDIARQSAEAQARQFGYNCDFIAFMPLPAGSRSSDHGLLCVNHEYTTAELMFPGLARETRVEALTREQVDIEMAAHGHSVVEVRKEGGKWRAVPGGTHNRRITARTGMRVAGPAAGHPRLKTNADPTGTRVLGTIGNCAGGVTPWGTVLTCEENFHNYFGGDLSNASEEARAREVYGIRGRARYAWSRFYERFDLAKEPNEPNRFGWVVEYDPYDPEAVPVKRTALGRTRHEGATTVLNPDGRLVAYMGDDDRDEHVYKFVTRGKVDLGNRAANRDLLDEGTLYAARFEAEGRLRWLPLLFGQGPLTSENGFASQADVVIEARRAARLLGATPMDRPEDIETSPLTGRVYCALTNNAERTPDEVNPANPRFNNKTGHILEIIPPGAGRGEVDHAATEAEWDFFLIAGNPVLGNTLYGSGVSENGWLACPDNLAFDHQGRIWIATDQGGSQDDLKIGDGLYGADLQGDGRAVPRFFFRTPVGAELCGPCLTPDDKTFFVAVQHPGEGSVYAAPSTRWPDFDPKMPPRPSVVAITKKDGGVIGG